MVSEYNLYCENEYILFNAQSALFIFTSCLELIAGIMADFIGRIKVLYGVWGLNLLGSLINKLYKNIWTDYLVISLISVSSDCYFSIG